MKAVCVSSLDFQTHRSRTRELHHQARCRLCDVVEHPPVLLVVIKLVGSHLNACPRLLFPRRINEGKCQEPCGKARFNSPRRAVESTGLDQGSALDREAYGSADQLVVVDTALEKLDGLLGAL